MSRKCQVAEESSAKVPAYIVTFSDMVTLLLTFFVMLLSLATMQDPELFNIGRDSFVESIRNLGLGMLLGKKETPDFGEVKINYYISGHDKFFKLRTIDAKEEGIRRIFKEVSRSMTTIHSQIVADRTNFSVTSIRFLPGDATLDEPAKRFLTEFCVGLQQKPDFKTISLYVLGLAGDVAAEKERWILSARRAQAVAKFLRGGLGQEGHLQNIYSWGAGAGGDWVGKDSPISQQSQISIAVLSK